DYVPGLINMGIVLAKLGDVREAESYLLQSLTLEPDNRHAIFNIALLYEKEGNYEKAREYYLRLKQLGDARGVLGLDRIGAK
ncbi:MAG: tetratricopeptide repeat protein, partial [Thermodesulfovibrionales bacterium]